MKEHLSKENEQWIVNHNSKLFASAMEHFHTFWGTVYRNGRIPPIFPGPQPISIERVHFKTLKSNPYVACEKTDGTRVALLAFTFEGKKVTLLVNRSLRMVWTPLNMPKSAHKGTLIDGELVDKTVMVYDAVYVSGEDVKGYNFLDRLEKLELFVKGIMRLAKDPVIIKTKNFVPLNELKDFQNNVVPKLPYKTDGLIFTPVNDPVRLGTHETMFKWKPRDENTIDFQVKWKPNGAVGLYIQDKGALYFESEITPDRFDDSFVGWLEEDAIVECRYMREEHPMWWKPVGRRTDKTYPNNRRTYYRTMVNIKEDIKWQEFI
jgi:hypothetical protein